MWVKYGLWIKRFPELWDKGRRWSGCLSSPTTPNTVGKGRMLCCPWCTSDHAWGCTVRCLSCQVHKFLLEWACPLSQNLLTLLYCLMFDTPTHYRFLDFLPTEPGFCGWGGNLKRMLALTTWAVSGHCALEICSLSEAGGCCQEHSVSLFFMLVASLSLIKTLTHWKFFDSTALIFPSPSTCLQYFFYFSFICSLALSIVSYFAFPVELFIL